MKTSVLILALLRFSSTISANLVGVISLAGVSIKRRARFCPEAKRTPLCQASWSSLAEENTRSPSDSLSEHWPQPARRALTEDKRKVMDRGCPHIFFVIWTREAAVMVYKELERLSWWVQRLRPWVSTAGGAGLIPGQGTKARHASWHGQKQKLKPENTTPTEPSERRPRITFCMKRGLAWWTSEALNLLPNLTADVFTERPEGLQNELPLVSPAGELPASAFSLSGLGPWTPTCRKSGLASQNKGRGPTFQDPGSSCAPQELTHVVWGRTKQHSLFTEFTMGFAFWS